MGELHTARTQAARVEATAERAGATQDASAQFDSPKSGRRFLHCNESCVPPLRLQLFFDLDGCSNIERVQTVYFNLDPPYNAEPPIRT
eukprot:scaffold25355_cov33-Phaeocystis_antarctica.AAC.1